VLGKTPRNKVKQLNAYAENGRINNVLEVHNINGRLTTRNVWYTTDDYGTLWRFVVTEGGVRFWWDAIHETAMMKILGYTDWSRHA
jgi:hypothetical protein